MLHPARTEDDPSIKVARQASPAAEGHGFSSCALGQ